MAWVGGPRSGVRKEGWLRLWATVWDTVLPYKTESVLQTTVVTEAHTVTESLEARLSRVPICLYPPPWAARQPGPR